MRSAHALQLIMVSREGFFLTCLGARLVAVPDTLRWVSILTVKLLQVVIEGGNVAWTKTLSPCGIQNLRCSEGKFGMAMSPPSHPPTSWNPVLEGRPPILCNLVHFHFQLCRRQPVTPVAHVYEILNNLLFFLSSEHAPCATQSSACSAIALVSEG
jgi:hypothetical protein